MFLEKSNHRFGCFISRHLGAFDSDELFPNPLFPPPIEYEVISGEIRVAEVR